MNNRMGKLERKTNEAIATIFRVYYLNHNPYKRSHMLTDWVNGENRTTITSNAKESGP